MGDKIPSQCSVTSNLSSVYQKYNSRINRIKWFGILIMLILTSTSLAFTSEMSHNKLTDYRDCLKITGYSHYKNHETNSAKCNYTKDFLLPEQQKVTVCAYRNVTIHLQHLSEGKLIESMTFSKKQWNNLLRLRNAINAVIEKAEKSL